MDDMESGRACLVDRERLAGLGKEGVVPSGESEWLLLSGGVQLASLELKDDREPGRLGG